MYYQTQFPRNNSVRGIASALDMLIPGLVQMNQLAPLEFNWYRKKYKQIIIN